MSCEQELCPYWTGNDGCWCALADISVEERRNQQRYMGIVVGDDEDGD